MSHAKKLPTDIEIIVLELLEGGKEMYGLEMVNAAPSHLGQNSIYVILTRMVAKGFLVSRLETKQEMVRRGPPRRLYKTGTYGTQMHEAWRAAEAIIEKSAHTKPPGTLRVAYG